MSTLALLHHLLHCFYSGLGQRDWNSIPASLIWSDSLRDIPKASARLWFSHARVTRARIPGFLHFLLSQPSQTNEKSRLFSPKTEDKKRTFLSLFLLYRNSTKNVPHFHKNVRDSHKNIRAFWKNMGEVLENVGAFLETLGNPPNSTRTLLPLSPKNRKEESLPSKTSIYFFHLKQRKTVSHSAPKLPDFSPRFPLFHQHSLNVC